MSISFKIIYLTFQDWHINSFTNGRSLLHMACDYGHLDIVEYLIKKGANINVSN